MNLALDEFADNPIIDELMRWPPRDQAMRSIRACNVLFRKPFIEVQLADGDVFQRHFSRADFGKHWAEASVILQTLTRAEIISEFDFVPLTDRDELARRALECRERCIAEADLMYEQGMYRQYLHQFGPDCRDLPRETLDRIERARDELSRQT